MSLSQIQLTSVWFYSTQKDFPIYNRKTREIELKVIPFALSIFARMALITFAAAGFYDIIKRAPFQYDSPLSYIKVAAQIVFVASLYIAIISRRPESGWSSESHISDLLKGNHSDDAIIEQIKLNPSTYGAPQDPEIILTAIKAKQFRPGLIDWVAACQMNDPCHWTHRYFKELVQSAHEKWACQTANKLKEKGLSIGETWELTTQTRTITVQRPIGAKPHPAYERETVVETPIWNALTSSWLKNSQNTTLFAQVLLEMNCQPEETQLMAPLHSLAVHAYGPWALTSLQTLIDSGLQVDLLTSGLWNSFEFSWTYNTTQTRKFIQLLLDKGFQHDDNQRISRRFRNEPIENVLLAAHYKNTDSPLHRQRLPSDLFKFIFGMVKARS